MNEKVFDEFLISEKADYVINTAIKKGSRKILLKRVVASISTLIIFMVVIFGTSYVSPSIACKLSKVPLIGNIFLSFTDDGLKTVSNKGLTCVTGLEVTKGDATIALKEVYYDKSQVSLGLAYKGISPYSGIVPLLYFKDTLISGSFNGGIIKASKGIYYTTITFNIPNNLPDKLDLKLLVQEQKGLQREFEFMVSIDRTGVNAATKEFNLMKKFEVDKGRNVFVKRVLFTPASISIEFEYIKSKLDAQPFRVKLYDDKGKEIKINSMSSTTDFTETSRQETYRALFNSVEDIPNSMKLDFLDVINDKAIISMNLEFYK